MASAWTSLLRLQIWAQPNSYSLLGFKLGEQRIKGWQPAFKLAAHRQHLVMPVILHRASTKTGTVHPIGRLPAHALQARACHQPDCHPASAPRLKINSAELLDCVSKGSFSISLPLAAVLKLV